MEHAESAAGYILVGGKSSRLGRDKALAEIEGQPLALRLAGVLRAAAGSVTLVGSPEKYGHLGLRIIPDTRENFGPLAGLQAALEDSSSGWNLVLACDMPHVTGDFLRFLSRKAQDSKADILLPVDVSGRPEPLCAAYSLRCRDAIRRAVEQEIHKMTRAFEGLTVQHLQPADYALFNRGGSLFANLNTKGDFEKAGLISLKDTRDSPSGR